MGPPGGVNISRCMTDSTSRATFTRNSSQTRRGRAFSPSPPLAPTFDRQSRAADNSGRHRFVVPIAEAGHAAPTFDEVEGSSPFLSPRPGVDVPAGTFTGREAVGRASRVPASVRRWGVALLLLLAFSGMLYATYRYVNGMRVGSAQQRPQAPAPGNRAVTAGNEFVTTTDVNLRNGPAQSYTKVGMAEAGSRVKVLQVSGRWYQVQVVEHGRAKADPDSEDQGWVNSTLLKAQ